MTEKKTKSVEVEAYLVCCSTCGLRMVVEKDIIFDDGKVKCAYCGVIYNLLW